MHTTSSEKEFGNFCIDAEVMMKIPKSKIKGLIADEVDCHYAEHTQAEVRTQIEKVLIDMLEPGNSAASNRIMAASARFLETSVVAVLSPAGLLET